MFRQKNDLGVLQKRFSLKVKMFFLLSAVVAGLFISTGCASDAPKKTYRRKIHKKRRQAQVVQIANVSAENLGFDIEALDSLMRQLEDNGNGTFVLFSEGHLVTSFQSVKGQLEKRVALQHLNMTLWSLAIGALIDDGMLAFETPMSEIFSYTQNSPVGKITVSNLIRERSGLSQRKALLAQKAVDPIRYLLEAPLKFQPGKHPQSYTLAMIILPAIVEKISQNSFRNYFAKRILEPLEIQNVKVKKGRFGEPVYAMSPLDFGRVGSLLAMGGSIKGKRLLDIDVIRRLVRPHGRGRKSMSWKGVYPQKEWALSENGLRFLSTGILLEEESERLGLLVGQFVPASEFDLLLLEVVDEIRLQEIKDWAVAHDVKLSVERKGKPEGVHLSDPKGQVFAVFPKQKAVGIRLFAKKNGEIEGFLAKLVLSLPNRKRDH